MNIYKILLFIISIASQHAYCSDEVEQAFKYELYKSSFTITATSNVDQQIGKIICEFNIKKDRAEIIGLDVIDSYQRKGIGTKLMLLALQNIKDKNIKKVYWISDFKAILFYKRFWGKHSTASNKGIEFEYVFERDGDPEENLKQYHVKE